jgi:hypothetical protein
MLYSQPTRSRELPASAPTESLKTLDFGSPNHPALLLRPSTAFQKKGLDIPFRPRVSLLTVVFSPRNCSPRLWLALAAIVLAPIIALSKRTILDGKIPYV